MQPAYRDKHQVVKDLKRLHGSGELTKFQDNHWFGSRPVEELYEIASDPHQLNNLALEDDYQVILAEHRLLLNNWSKDSKDLGKQPEAVEKLIGTYELWKDNPVFEGQNVNPEYKQFQK